MTKTVAVAIAALTALALPAFSQSADAAKPAGFASCAKLANAYPYGVAKSRAAASRQARAGNYRPVVRPAVYKASKRLDRDRDGTACEKRKQKPATPPPPVDPWVTMAPSSMLPLKVMDFTTGTSLDASNGYSFKSFFDTDDTYVEEKPVLSDGTPVTGFGGSYYTDAPLVAGRTYDFTLTVTTPAYWDCSMYDPDGCSWTGNFIDVMQWRFTATGQSGVIGDASKVSWKRLYR